jgi:hypothetical protein
LARFSGSGPLFFKVKSGIVEKETKFNHLFSKTSTKPEPLIMAHTADAPSTF